MRPRQKRLSRNLVLAAGGVLLTWLLVAVQPGADQRHRLSMATAYTAMLYLAISLSLGPWNVLRRRPNPISFDLRRDWGIWCGVFALLHTGIGLTVHLRGRMWMYFFQRLHPLALQKTQFGAANYTGLIAAVLFLGLLAISNDISLRKLGSSRWKTLQRWTYVACALTVVHGVLYQQVEKRAAWWVAALAGMTAWAVVLQVLGIRRRRDRGSAEAAGSDALSRS